MKKALLFILVAPLIFWGCGGGGSGELIGVMGRAPWYQPNPYGMLYLPMGSYHMGPSDQDVPYSQTAQAKTVSVQAFYMDQTEITNNEYRQFVFYVRDSIARRIIGEEVDEEYFVMEDIYGDEIDPPLLNWRPRIYWNGDDEREALIDMFLPEHERFYRRKEIDTRKLMFEYYWIDLRDAARKAGKDLDLYKEKVY